MAASHQEVVVTDSGFVTAGGATVDGDIFTKNIVVAYDHAGFFAVEFQVLR